MKIFKYVLVTILSLFSTVSFTQTTAPVTFRIDLNNVIGNVPNSNSAQVFVQTNVAN